MIKKAENNYRIVLKRFFLATLFLFISSCCIIFYVKLSLVAGQFLANVQGDKSSIEKDFQKIQRIHHAQLSFVKRRIEDIKDNPKKLRGFLEDTQILIEVGSTINTIIITDENFNVLMSGQNTSTTTPSLRLEKGHYRNILKRSPDKIILGEIVESIVTKKPVIPLAASIQDKNGKMLGAIVFSISLQKLENNLSHGRLFKVFIEDNKTSLVDDEAYYKLLESPNLFFVFEILNPMNSQWGISTLENVSQKYLHLQYNTHYQKIRFIKALVPPYMIIFILFIIVNLLFYFYVISPMKPAMELLNKVSDNHTIGGNIFTKLTNLMVVQSGKLKEQSMLSQEQQMHLIALRDLSKHSISTIKNIAENLTEEVGDLITTQNQSFLVQYKELLKELQQKIANNEHSTKLILDTSVEILHLLANDTKERCSIMELLLESGVNESLIMETFKYDQTNTEFSSSENQNIRKFLEDFMIYKRLFYKLVQEILSCENEVNILSQVFIRGEAIDFVFKVTDNESISGFNINLTRCKMLSVFNNVHVKCLYNQNQIIVTCTIN
jgi:hypothetical protein